MDFARITGTKNAIVKEAVRLHRKRNRYERKQFLAEGEDLLEAAIAGGVRPRQVFVLEDAEEILERLEKALEAAAMPPAEIGFYSCSRPVMEKISLLGSGSRMVAAFDFFHQTFPADGSRLGKLPLVYLAGIADPGNLGTIFRSAAALGASGVALGPQTADPYSPKAVRASMGAIFAVPLFIDVGTGKLVDHARRSSRRIICTDSHDGEAAWDADIGSGTIIVFGSERTGIPAALTETAAEIVRIPVTRRIDSINAAMAATTILYEAARQRDAAR